MCFVLSLPVGLAAFSGSARSAESSSAPVSGVTGQAGLSEIKGTKSGYGPDGPDNGASIICSVCLGGGRNVAAAFVPVDTPQYGLTAGKRKMNAGRGAAAGQ